MKRHKRADKMNTGKWHLGVRVVKSLPLLAALTTIGSFILQLVILLLQLHGR